MPTNKAITPMTELYDPPSFKSTVDHTDKRTVERPQAFRKKA